MPVSQITLENAFRAAKAFPDDPEVQRKAGEIREQYRREMSERQSVTRTLFTDRDTHGLAPETLGEVAKIYGGDPNAKYRLFNDRFFREFGGVEQAQLDAMRPSLRKAYSEKTWGEPVTDEKAFYDRLGAEFDFEDSLNSKAVAAALSNKTPLDAFADLETEDGANPIYSGRKQQWRDQFTESARRTRERVAPYGFVVKSVANILQAKTGTGGDGAEAESFRDLAGYLMEVPKDDRELVIAAIAAAGTNDEAGRKGVMKKLAESFGRGVLDYSENIPANIDRRGLLMMRNQASIGGPVEGDASTPEGYLRGLGIRVARAGDPTGTAALSGLLEGEEKTAPGEQAKAGAIEAIDKQIEAIDFAARLRNVAETDIDPISSDWMAMRGLYSAARSMPYTLAAVVPGGAFVNAAMMSEMSYQELRARNPEMTAEQANAIATVAGPLQAALEQISGKVLTGRLPSFNRFANQVTVTRGAAAARFGARLGAATGIELAQENLQDLTPSLVQGAFSALSEDVPGMPWSDVFGDMANNQGELFFSVLPLALIGAGAGTVRDFRGAREMLGSYDELRALGLTEAAASEVRAKAVANDLEGAQTLLRQEFRTLGTDQKAIQEARAGAIPKLIEQRERVRELVNQAGDLDMLPAIRNEGGGMWSVHYNDGSGMSFNSFQEADARRWQVASDENLSLHQDTVSTIRRVDSDLEAGRELKYLFSLEDPTLTDMQAKGLASEEQGAQRIEIADALQTEFDRARVSAELAGASVEDRAATAKVLGSSVNEFRDNIVRTTIRLYQGATPFTVIEEKTEGDAKFMVQQQGLRKWMLSGLRDWERISGDKLFRTADDAAIENQDLIEAWSALSQAYFVGRSKKGDQGPLFAGSRGAVAKMVRSPLNGAMTAYAKLFKSVLHRAALVAKARREGSLDKDLEEFLARSTGMSEQRMFERDVAKEGEQLAGEMSATFSVLPGTDTDTAYLSAVESGDMGTAQRMVDEAAKAAGGRQVESDYNLDPEDVNPRNSMDPDFGRSQVATVARALRRNGWEGRPILVAQYGDTTQGITGSHRTIAARIAKVDLPVVAVPDDFFAWLNDRDANTSNLIDSEGWMNAREEDQLIALESAREAGIEGLDSAIDLLFIENESNWLDRDKRNLVHRNPWILGNQIKSADPVTYDESGNIIPLSQRFNPARDEITYSLLPDASNLDNEFARMFSPFQRSPELRVRLVQEMQRRALNEKRNLEPILRANRTKKSIDAERKKRQEEIFTAKLDTISAAEWSQYEAAQSVGQESLQPILNEILRKRTFTRKDGRKGFFWQGILMSKTEAKRRGYNIQGGEWDDIPEGLPSYIWGGSVTPDEAASMFDKETISEFWDALTSEIAAWQNLRAGSEKMERQIAEMKREARAEALEWAEKAMQERETVGTDRNTLIGFLRTLEAIKRALPSEVRGKIGGVVALTNLTTPGAMLGEIERQVERIDTEVEKWLKTEAEARRKKLFEKAKPKREAGKKPKGKAGADIHDLFDKLRESLLMDGDEAESYAAGLEATIAKGELSAEAEAHKSIEANLVRLFSDWKNADAARRTAAVEAAEEVYATGYQAEQKRRAAERERRAEIRAEIIAGTGKLGTRSERIQKAQQDAGLSGKWKENFLSLFNFEQVAGFAFGADSKWSKWFGDGEREADAKKTDEVQEVLNGLDDLFRELGGSRLGGEKLQWKLSQPSFETAQGGKMSEMQGLTAILMWRQEDGRRHMKGKRDENGKLVSSWSYDETFIEEIEANLSDEAWKVLDYLTEQYAGEYDTLNPIFRELNGINLPRNPNYSPLTVKPVQSSGNQMEDPLTGTTMSNGSITPGSLRTRAQVVAEPEFRDAIATFVAHKKQLAHWKAYAVFNRDAHAILGNREIGNAIEAASGQEAVKVLRSWLDVFAQGGARDAAAHLALSKGLGSLVGRASAVQLVGRIGTLAVQVTQLGAAAAKMPLRAYTIRLSKLLTGNLSWGEALSSPYVQRRLAEMPPSVKLAMEGLTAKEPNLIKHATRRLGRLISGTDALFTAGTYAIVQDYQYSQFVKAGVDPVAAAELSRIEAERITDEIAQPTRAGARSIFEVRSTSGLGRISWAFASEARKNLALLIFTGMKRDKIAAARAILFVHVLNGALAAVIRDGWKDLRDDEEDEDDWSLKRIALSAAAEPLYGFPIVGDLLRDTIMKGAGEFVGGGTIVDTPARAVSSASRLVSGESEEVLKDVESVLMALGLANDTLAGAASISHLVRDVVAVVENLTD